MTKPENCFVFTSQLWLPAPVEVVFQFFGDAANLQAITPEWLNFCIITPGRIEMRPGALIDYKLRVHGIPIRWQTEITEWCPYTRFVDEQRRGPYRTWIHEHRFTSQNGGTLAEDLVHYRPPMGWLMDRLFVRGDIERIFKHRCRKLLEHFSVPVTAPAGTNGC